MKQLKLELELLLRQSQLPKSSCPSNAEGEIFAKISKRQLRSKMANLFQLAPKSRVAFVALTAILFLSYYFTATLSDRSDSPEFAGLQPNQLDSNVSNLRVIESSYEPTITQLEEAAFPILESLPTEIATVYELNLGIVNDAILQIKSGLRSGNASPIASEILANNYESKIFLLKKVLHSRSI